MKVHTFWSDNLKGRVPLERPSSRLADNIRRVLRGTKLSLFIEDLEMLLS
jgi:hypothetical protein